MTYDLTITKVDTSVQVNNDTLTATQTAVSSYQWLDCDNSYSIVNGATNQNFSPLSNGNYAVVIVQNSCIDTSSCYNFTLLNNQLIFNEDNWTVYPNPTTGKLMIAQTNPKIIDITIIDNLGRMLIYKKSEDHTIELDLGNLPSGMYCLLIEDGEQIVNRKIVKQTR
jgi:hypothetical protein